MSQTIHARFVPTLQALDPRNRRRIARIVLVLLISLPCIGLAAPPSWAPAHGWRSKHDPTYAGYSGRHWDADYGVYSGRCDRAAIGAVLGGVAGWVHEQREQPAPSTPTKYLKPGSRSGDLRFSFDESADQPALPASRRLVRLFLKHTDQLDPEDLTLRDQLLTHPTLFKTRQFAQDFQRMVREREAPSFEIWLRTCETDGIPEFANFATGLRQDDQAVNAALTLAWSNGQTEGQVNKLKLLKRQMYGRANLDLLRLRALYPT